MLEIFAYHTVAVMHFTDQNWIPKTFICVRCVMVCGGLSNNLANWNAKIVLLRASMVVIYYIKLFRTGADRHKGILMSLFLLVAETIRLIRCMRDTYVLYLRIKRCPLKNYKSKSNLFWYTLATCKCWPKRCFKWSMSPIFSELFRRLDICYNLRSNSNFAVPNVKSVFYGSESISYLGQKIWDIVPLE